MNHNKRDDSISGVTRYIPNTFGFLLTNATAGSIDEIMSTTQIREKWRQATYSCKCPHPSIEQTIYGGRAFCPNCSFIIFHHKPPNLHRCPGCLQQDSWSPIRYGCLACQFATIIFRNRFADRYNRYLEQWLPIN